MNITKSLPIVAKAIGDQMGVKVIVGGTQAATDGETIYLPTLPEDNDEAVILARGFLDHEAAHVRLTDFSVEKGSTPLMAGLANIIEDVRIEKKMGQLYPGCAVNLRNLANHLAEKGEFDPDWADPASLLCGWILSRCRNRVLKQAGLIPLFERINNILSQLIGQSLLDRVDKLLDQVGVLDSTQESTALAKKIMKLLQQEQQQSQCQCRQEGSGEDDAPQQNDGGGEQEQEQNENQEKDQEDRSKSGTDEEQNSRSDCQGDSNSDGNGGTRNQEDGHQADPDGEASSGSGTDKDHNNGNPAAGSASAQQRSESLRKILSSQQEDYGDIGEMVAEKLEGMAVFPETAGENCSMLYPGETFADDLQLSIPPDLFDVRKETSALRSRLGSLIQASKLKRSCAGRSGRRIDQRVLARLPVGDTRIFRRKEEKTAVNTAVIVLLDRSGSMSGNNRITLAAQATLALADALYAVPGVSVSVASFPGKNGSVVPLTPFGASPARTINNYGICPDGGTPLAHALGWAAVQFAHRQESRKILVVATDGVPSSPGLVLAYLKRLAAQGVEQIGLGIEDQGLCGNYFPNYRTVRTVSELPNAMFDMLKDALT
ncbi:VWA domain-containing protein [Geothermobacter hydrogeniphilus]|uniref:VWFA domain-containing protein n=1 Tax=Geothermobacter hydrogeniphilus TaxID=1969733 RepID=A0A1X0Y832_9BACT|nr:VWA domain-containing protein [Geothermobacter hydrogeniphilus]ORJ61325.1 hypothetical protein B5V00_06750 [Geothermobacter hydrogeniphilus]